MTPDEKIKALVDDMVSDYWIKTIRTSPLISVCTARNPANPEFQAFCREQDEKRGIHRENPAGAIDVESEVVKP